jgi:hypothetical protein
MRRRRFHVIMPDGRLNEIRTNHNPSFSPVIRPTVQTGVDALIVAARVWLAP